MGAPLIKKTELVMKLKRVLPTTALCGLALIINASVASASDPSRQAEVSARGAGVMPFDLTATTHLFSKNKAGGVQQVIAKSSQDSTQIRLIREHLREIADQFTTGNFTGPTHIHGASMPGLNELKNAKPGEVSINYQDLPGGGQIRYSTASVPLIAALHRWFDAQLSDHGTDAKEGHDHHGGMHK